MPAAVTRAANSAAIVEGFSWVVLVIFWIAGIALATQTRNSGFGSSDHPYVFIGLGLAIGGSINCLMIIMVAAYIKAKMELARLER